MPTRYTLDVDFKASVSNDVLENSTKKVEVQKVGNSDQTQAHLRNTMCDEPPKATDYICHQQYITPCLSRAFNPSVGGQEAAGGEVQDRKEQVSSESRLNLTQASLKNWSIVPQQVVLL